MVDSDSIKVNDGLMLIEIVGYEMVVGTGRKHNVYRIKGYDSLG